MEYYIHYDATTGMILERRPKDEKYPTPIPTPYVQVSQSDFLKSLSGKVRINIKSRLMEDLPPTSYNIKELKTRKKTEISGARYRAERAGMMFNGHLIATDDVGQNKINGAKLSAMEDGAYTIPEWLCADGTFISLSNEDILELGRALRDHTQDKFRINKVLFDAIDAAVLPIQLEAIEWSDEI